MSAEPPSPQPPGQDPPERVEDIHPIRLARMLAERWAELSGSARQVCLAELQEGGVLEEVTAPPKASAVEQFVKLPVGREAEAAVKKEVLGMRLKLDESKSAEPLDLLGLLSVLVDLARHVGVLGEMLGAAWPAWHGLSRSSRLQPSPASRQSVEMHLHDALTGRLKHGLGDALRDQQTAARLLIAILTGLGQGSQSFGRDLSQLLDPEQIQRDQRKQVNRAPTAEEQWARYKRISNALTPGEIERQLQQHITTAAEAFFHAAQRK